MFASDYFFVTHREAPAEAELISHKLMVRAGLIKKLGSGLYTWMPLGLRVLRKVEKVVREEMNNSGAFEVLMPAIQPADLWYKSNRWDKFGPQMLKIKDRHSRDYCFGPTHEEVITDLASQEIHSYKQLPVHFYQIQTKFRDEIRPRFGVMRAREFIMKDGYSFHTSKDDLEKEYQKMYETYSRIFTKIGLKFRAVSADTGSIGGSDSHEFHVLADSGEDTIAFCRKNDYAANLELATSKLSLDKRYSPKESLKKENTPGIKTCADVASFFGIAISRTVKTLIIFVNSEPYMLLLRGDHSLNESKLLKFLEVDKFRFADIGEITDLLNCPPGYIGPRDISPKLKVISDAEVINMSDFVCGSNEENSHLIGVNFGRDIPEPWKIGDIRNIVPGDLDPSGTGKIELCKGIEVGHIFQLGRNYSEKLNSTFLDKDGTRQPFEMGCYGIGISRIVAAAIEQNYDDRGIIWPVPIAPFQVAIAAIGFNRNPEVKKASLDIKAELEEAGVEVFLDDRDERPGVMFSDLDLIGIPYRITIGERTLKDGKVDIQSRAEHIPLVPLEEEMRVKVNDICKQIKSLNK